MITVIDCGISNLHSIAKAIETVGGQVCVSNKAEDLKKADKIVLPGVGAFGRAMENLRRAELIAALNKEVLENKKPFLGICLGLQVLAKQGMEFGESAGLGWFDAKVVPFNFKQENLRIPHMGWDDIEIIKDTPLFSGLDKKSTFYFVHSYYMDLLGSDVAAECEYGVNFPAAILRGNIFAVQFHPEKSQKAGLKLLENFVNWKV